MSNSYFQLKQFRIEQDACAMKVSTDACIQGAWTPVEENVQRVLDIGTGTGLLSLMLAQRSPGILIDAIESDKDAAAQAQANIAASPWKEKINIIEGDVREQFFSNQYDLVICNPPFFRDSLLGTNDERNRARHTLTLSYVELLHVLGTALKEEGYASILLPAAEHKQWERLLQQKGWHILSELNIKPKGTAAINRVVSLCSRMPRGKKEVTLIIYEGAHHYTAAFMALMKEYYLNL